MATIPGRPFTFPPPPRTPEECPAWAQKLTTQLVQHFRRVLALPAGGIEDGQFLKRAGGLVIGTAGSGGGAPTTAEYVVATADAGLSAERVAIDTATVDVDMLTAAQAKWHAVGLRVTGPVDLVAGAVADGEFLRRVGATLVGAAAGSVDIKAATITAPYDSYDYSEVVVDAAVTGASQILLGWGATTDADENTPDMEDAMNFQAIPGTGQFTARITSPDAFGGPFKLNYLVG